MTALGWVQRGVDLARNVQSSAESARHQVMRDGNGMLPDDYDARACTALDKMCRAIREAVRELEALENMAKRRRENAAEKW